MFDNFVRKVGRRLTRSKRNSLAEILPEKTFVTEELEIDVEIEEKVWYFDTELDLRAWELFKIFDKFNFNDVIFALLGFQEYSKISSKNVWFSVPLFLKQVIRPTITDSQIWFQ